MFRRPGNPMHFSAACCKVHADAVLTLISGLVSLVTAVHCYRATPIQRYKRILLGPDSRDTIGWCTTSIIVLGLANILIAGRKILSKTKIDFNLHVGTLVATLVANFIIGIVLTDFRSQVISGMMSEMRGQLRESVITRAKFGVGYQLSESWDFLQTKMSCCGVETYHDYLNEKESPRDQPIPVSCCVMKIGRTGEQEPENISQCMMDAKRRVQESVFLHARGCHVPLSSWLLRHISMLTGLLFISILCQALAILYLSWQGYQKTSSIKD